MTPPKRDYDSTVARMAGNIAAGLVGQENINLHDLDAIAQMSVRLARAILVETKRTEPAPASQEESQ